MNFTFLLPGKLKELYIEAGVKEYEKRLSKYGKVTIKTLPEESLPRNASQGMVLKALKTEADRALKLIPEGSILFLCDIHAKEVDTDGFASLLSSGSSKAANLIFLFGSSCGLDDSLRKRADYAFSLSKLTFTHYMALLLTMEQVYRAEKILHNEAYDK